MMDRLPEECVSAILSLTSPADACRCSVVSSTFQSASDSDLVWLTFLPFDYHHILSRSLFPLHFSSKKQLFLALSRSLLIDGGNKVFIIHLYLFLPIHHFSIHLSICFLHLVNYHLYTVLEIGEM